MKGKVYIYYNCTKNITASGHIGGWMVKLKLRLCKLYDWMKGHVVWSRMTTNVIQYNVM